MPNEHLLEIDRAYQALAALDEAGRQPCFGMIIDFDPRNSRFALVEAVVAVDQGRQIVPVVVDCVICRERVDRGSVVVFQEAGAGRDTDGVERIYGIASMPLTELKQGAELVAAFKAMHLSTALAQAR
jgi:hypothetical protein